MGIKGRSTQHIVNTFPSWSDIRKDEQSLGYQLINPIGKVLDDLKSQLEKVRDNYYISSANIGDLDIFYTVYLPDTFEFSRNIDDNTDLTYSAPTVSGIQNDINYSVTLAERNNVETFWYLAVPDRISLIEEVNENHILVTGLLLGSPFAPLTSSGLTHIPNKLTITLEGGNSYITLQDNNMTSRGIIQIEGVTREGLPLTEELSMFWDGQIQTQHDYRSLNETRAVRVYGIEDPTTTFITVASANFNASDYKVNYELDMSVDKEPLELFWALGSGLTGQKTLDLKKYETDNLELRLEGFVDKFVLIQQELLNQSGMNIIPRDLTIQPYSDNIWIIDDTNLYLYSAKFPYSDLELLEGKQYDAYAVIEPSSYYAIKDEEITLEYVWRRPVIGLVAHRVWVQKPDGTKKSLENGIEVDYHTDRTSWIFGEPTDRLIRPTEFYTLNQRGSYLYTLEVVYTNQTTSIDKRVISVLYQEPLAQFYLPSISIPEVIGIDMDSEQKLWVLGTNGYKYQIHLHYDKMLIDFSKKILYFREPYERVRVF